MNQVPAVWDWDTESQTFLASQGLRDILEAGSSRPFGVEDYLSRIHPDHRGALQELFAGRATGDQPREMGSSRPVKAIRVSDSMQNPPVP